jgi:probable F420-dependent oxidoreductase
MDREFEVGAWLTPQHCTIDQLRAAWRAAEDAGADSLWLWDHFFPLTGDPDGVHFEGWTLLSVLAVDTSRATVGMLVTNASYRNPDLLADMARTVDHLSGGRAVLGMGAGWFERDCTEYGYPFPSGRERVQVLENAVERVRGRLGRLVPGPMGPLPLLLAGDGQQHLLRVAATHADLWNTMAWRFVESSQALDRWCEKVGRDPAEIRRTAFLVGEPDRAQVDELLAAGAQHLMLQMNAPYDLAPLRALIERAGG